MRRPIITTTGIAATLLAGGAMILAPSASADNDAFNELLRDSGVDTSSVDTQLANVDLGLATCNMLNVTQSPTATVDSLVNGGNHTQSNANIWMFASVIALCPEMDYLTHYQQAVSRKHPGCILNSLDRFQCGD
jgi:hypothetical protein